MLTNLIIFLRLALFLLIRLLGTSLWFFGLLPIYLVGALVMPSHRFLPKVRALMNDLEPGLLVPTAPGHLPGYRNPPPPPPRRNTGGHQPTVDDLGRPPGQSPYGRPPFVDE